MASVATSAIPSNYSATIPVAISATARGVPTSQSPVDESDFSSVLAQTNAATPPIESDPRAKPQTAASKQSAATANATGAKPAGQSISGTMPKIADPKQADIALPKDSGQTKSSSNPKKVSSPTNSQSTLAPTQKRDSATPPFIGGMQTGPIPSEPTTPLLEQTGSHSESSGSPSETVDPPNLPGAQTAKPSDENGADPETTAETSPALQDGLLDTLMSGITPSTTAPASKSAAQLQGKTSSQLNALMQSLQPNSHRATSAPGTQPQTPTSQSDANAAPQPAQKQGSDSGSSNGGHGHGEQARNSNDSDSSQSQQPSSSANVAVTTPAPAAANTGTISNPGASGTSGISAAIGTQNSATAASGAALQVTPQATAQASQPDFNALAINIAAKSQAGSKQFDISLEPAELGRVEVRLTVDSAGNAQAHLVAERPETLQMLQRDSGTLSHALKESGVQLGDNGLQFSLKGQERQGDGAQQGASRGRPLSASIVTSTDKLLPVSSTYGLSLSRAGIDIRV